MLCNNVIGSPAQGERKVWNLICLLQLRHRTKLTLLQIILMGSLFALVDEEYVGRPENTDLRTLIELLEIKGTENGRCPVCHTVP